jgi:uncharacterized protein (DUF885 family)
MTRTEPATTAATAAFDELLGNYFKAWFRFHPESAVDVGDYAYAGLLTPFTEEDMGALVCLNDELLVGLEELDPAGLDPDRRLDYELMLGAARIENQRLLDIDPRRPDPMRMLPINAIYQLTIRPVPQAEAALRARLAAIPVHLEAARDFLIPRAAEVPRVWAESAAVAAAAGVTFLRALAQHPKLAACADPQGLDAARGKAGAALGAFAEFLRRDIVPGALGALACGWPHFELLLRSRHFLDVDIDRLYDFGKRLVADTQGELRATCRALVGSEDSAQALRHVRREHPTRDALLDTYRAGMRAAREFLQARDVVTLPAREHLEVIETPVFLRHQIPFAAYCDPAPNDPSQHGYYYVTPPTDDAELAEHDLVGIQHTCAHEAWPGHHLHFVSTHLNPTARSLPRLLNPSAASYEGWALYSEQLMQEQGFLNQPESRYILLRDRLWRGLRVMIDIDLHTRGLSLEDAAARLTQHLGFPRSQALADVTWYTRAPTVPLGYATGWAVINALRRRAQASGLELKAFHDRLLSAGAIALPLAIARAFGPAEWDAVRAELFAGVKV